MSGMEVREDLGERSDRMGEGVVVALGELFAGIRARHRIPGIGFGVVDSQGLWAVGWEGWADLESGRPVTAESVFRIASMTKSITAWCLLALRDAGALTLDDPVNSYVPELRFRLGAADWTEPLTLRQLLTMSAGLVEDDPWADRQLAMSASEFSHLVRSGLPLNRPPGCDFEYSNLGYAILGRVVEVVSGTTLPDFAAQHLFVSVGMNCTHFEFEEVSLARRVLGYRDQDGSAVAEAPLHHGAFGAMGGVWTSIEDFGRYVRLHLAAARFGEVEQSVRTTPSTLREMQQSHRAIRPGRPVRPGVTGLAYGFGLFSGWHERQGRVVFHSGGLPGFGSHVEWLPDCDLAVFAFANLTYAPMRVAVAEAIEHLDQAGVLNRGETEPAAELVVARELVIAGYNTLTLDGLGELVATNLFVDSALSARNAELARLQARHGPCLTAAAIRPAGRLRCSFTMHCERGDVDCEIWLSPTSPPKVQRLAFNSVAGE